MSIEYPFWLGGIAASLAATCTHPLDVTKVRMQTLDSAHGTKHPSTISIIRTSISQSGFRTLYVGLSASLMRQMSYSLVRLGSYEKMKTRLSRDGNASTGRLLLAACIAGGLGGVAGNPADIILVRMTSDLVRPPEMKYNYSNAFSGLFDLIRTDGFQGLLRGIGTNTFRAVLMNMSQVGSYDFIKETLLAHPLPVIDYQFHDNLLLHLSSSCMAGMFATTICSPADVMRSRLMASSGNASFVRVITRSFKDEGVRFLFKGWTPSFIRLGPNTVLMFVFYEQIKKAWKSII
ncbi:dicarboxylic acid transporter [Pholiota conissans]|uniref:Dicarboxylic acid transporter n=1 Tax=Pholiota conissans TaxID=109636 RepID=A0A9P5YPT8_9AGAR|nr:dicarboxylic acid transporter [Pholiota conissans]